MKLCIKTLYSTCSYVVLCSDIECIALKIVFGIHVPMTFDYLVKSSHRFIGFDFELIVFDFQFELSGKSADNENVYERYLIK
jgi:hypothetical protein